MPTSYMNILSKDQFSASFFYAVAVPDLCSECLGCPEMLQKNWMVCRLFDMSQAGRKRNYMPISHVHCNDVLTYRIVCNGHLHARVRRLPTFGVGGVNVYGNYGDSFSKRKT